MDRFWNKVDVQGPSECWLWKAGKTGTGYGTVWYNQRARPAHVVALILATDREPGFGELACHHCDVPGRRRGLRRSGAVVVPISALSLAPPGPIDPEVVYP